MGTFGGGGNSKGENNEKIRKTPATNVADITLILVPRAANRGISGTPKTLGMHYKKGWSQQQKPFSISKLEQKDPLKNSFRIQKMRKEGKYHEGS